MFNAPGRFYRGNLHTHSTNSDGVKSPQEVCEAYAAEGYDFISLTDHFIGLYDYPITDCSPFHTNQFTTILGAELHSGAQENGAIWHILAVGLPADFTPSNSPTFFANDDQESGPEIAQRARDAGAFVAIAHPHWSVLTLDDARSLKAAHAVEVYNHGCGVESDRGYGTHTLDQLLSEGQKLTLCATDDAHFATADHFGGWVMVKAEENTAEALLEALKNGFHYSTQGPEFTNITVVGDKVHVECSEVTTVIVSGSVPQTDVVFGDGITSAEVPLGRLQNSPWVRVTLIDKDGNRAWSNPIWFD
ncbi:MAG: CehA/McbA family metallohydrolase [Rhizobiaceae bacterium]